MSDPNITIRVGSTADTRGFEQSEAALRKNEEAAKEFINTLKLGVGIDLGGKIVESIRDIPNILREATAQGLEFNRSIQDSTIAVAGALRSVDDSLTFAQAKAKGTEAIEQIRQKALALGLDFHSLMETFSVNVPTMWHAGIRDTQKMIDLITLLNQVAASKGIDGFQAQRDIIDLLNGQGQRTILGKELEANGVTSNQLEAAKEAGTLYEFLAAKLGSYGEAGAAAANTQSAALQRLKTEWNSLLGEITKPLFDDLTDGINTLSKELASPEGKEGLRELGLEIRDVTMGVMGLAEWAVKNSSSLVAWGESAGLLALAFAALKITDLVQGFFSLGLRLTANATLWGAETAAVVANTAALEANAAAGASAAAAGGSGAAAGGARAGLGLAGAAGAAGSWAGAIGMGIAGGWALDRWVLDPTTSLATGTATNDIDRESAEQLRKDSKIPALLKKRREAETFADWDKLKEEVEKYAEQLRHSREKLGWNDGMQKQFYDQELKLTESIAQHSGQEEIDPSKVMAAFDADQAKRKREADKEAAQKKAEQEAKNEEANKKRAEQRAEARQQHEEGLSNQLAVETARQAAARGEYSDAIPSRLAELDKLAAANPRIDDTKADPKKVAARDRLNDFVDASKEQLQKALEQQNLAAWKAQEQAADALKQKQIDALKEQDALIEAQGKKRLADLEASGKSEHEIAAERTRLEDDIAAKRIDLQNQIGQLEGESWLARETREDLAAAAKITRDHAGHKRPDDTTNYSLERDTSGRVSRYIPMAAKGQVLDSDPTQRKGFYEEQHSRLADFAAQQAPGALRHPWEALPLPGPATRPGAALAGASSSSPSGSDPAKAVQDAGNKAALSIDRLSSATVAAIGKVEAAAANALKRIEQVAAQVDRLKRT